MRRGIEGIGLGSVGSYVTASCVERKRKGNWIACGLGNDLDREIDWDAAPIVSLCVEAGVGLAAVPDQPPRVISTLREFLEVLLFHFRRGVGGEIPISDERVCRIIEQRFSSVPAGGGSGVRAACALGALGFPVLLHMRDSPGELLDALGPFSLHTVRGEAIVPVARGASNALPDAPHFIFQFAAGDLIEIDGGRIVCPRSDRVILTFDQIGPTLPVDDHFLRHAASPGVTVTSLLLSGFNSVKSEELLRERIERLVPILHTLRSRRTSVFVEDAGYHDPELKRTLLDGIGSLIDIFSFNEQEFADTMRLHGRETSCDDADVLLASLDLLVCRNKMGAVLLHTEEFSLFYGNSNGKEVDKGLTVGNAVAAIRASTGRYAVPSDFVSAWGFRENQRGLVLRAKIETGARDGSVWVRPTHHVWSPPCTIGLGDVFAGGFQSCL